MATLKYSRQRESIKEFLTGRTDHPTADFVYENMKKYRSFPALAEQTDSMPAPLPIVTLCAPAAAE